MRLIRFYLGLIILISPLLSLPAQERFHSSDIQLYRNLRLLGFAQGYIGNFQSYSSNRWYVEPTSLWHPVLNRRSALISNGKWSLYPSSLLLRYSFNSALPDGSYDQAQWQGKGNNLRLDGGLGFNWKGLTITMEASFWFAQNQDYDLIPVYENQKAHEYWFYEGGKIDYPQRPTDKNLVRFSLGQSGIRYSGQWWTAGLSNENVWIGPARFFPVIMSDQADGFPHIDLGTLGYVPVRIKGVELGTVETRLLLGFVRESKYFDNNNSNDFNQILGITSGYSFPFLKNLRFGANFFRLKSMYDFPTNFWQVFNPSEEGEGAIGDNKSDSVLSLTFSWMFPQIGMEFYGEYARNDYSPSITTLISRIDHSNGYTIGFQKSFPLEGRRILSMTAEITDLFQVPFSNRANQPIWYKHFDVSQGYTNKGQLLGSPVGPGSDSQIIQFDYFDSYVLWSFWLQRTFIDKDYFYSLTVDNNYNHDSNYSKYAIGASRQSLTNIVDWKISLSYHLHMNYGWKPGEYKHNLIAALTFEY